MKWWEKPWNPVVGCTEISEECIHCWARSIHERFHKDKKFSDVELKPQLLDNPLKRKVKTTYFVCNVSDLFHDDVPVDFIREVYAVMTLAYWHNFFVLTKRPERAFAILTDEDWYNSLLAKADVVRLRNHLSADVGISDPRRIPPKNIAFGVTAGNEHRADQRIPIALRVPAYRHFLSYEPALGPLDFSGHRLEWIAPFKETDAMLNRTPRLDLIIAGGENHPDAMDCNVNWFRKLLRQCKPEGTRVCIKQLGTHPFEVDPIEDDLALDASYDEEADPADVAAMAAASVRKIKVSDRAGAIMEEWPEDLRVQESLEFGYPDAQASSGRPVDRAQQDLFSPSSPEQRMWHNLIRVDRAQQDLFSPIPEKDPDKDEEF